MTLDEARILAGDLLDNRPRAFSGPDGLYEDLSAQVPFDNDRFVTGWAPILATTLVVIADNAPATAGEVNEETGEFTVVPQPVESLLARYHHRRFTQAEVDLIIATAARHMRATTTLDALPDGLIPAWGHFVKAEGWRVLAAKVVERVSVTLGPRSEQEAQMAERWAQLSQQEYELGIKARDDYFTGPWPAAAGRATYRQRVYTPRR